MTASVQAQILYDNAYRRADATVTYDGAIVVGMEPINAYDWRDFSVFKSATGTTRLTAVLAGGDLRVDSFVAWPVPSTVTAAVTITAEASYDGGGTWVPLGTLTFGVGDTDPKWSLFTETPGGAVSNRVRIVITSTVAVSWRQLTVGKLLQFPIGQWTDVAPPKLLHGVVTETVISVNGSILARNLRRITKEGKISLQYLDPAWVRSSWNPFAIHASKYAFWWRWDPVSYPTEFAFAVADNIDAPKNSKTPGKMEVSMPLLYLA